jgi:predicted nucleic acid-binding protein
MIIDNTKSNKQLAQVIASMAIEKMYFSEEFIKELLKVSNGEKTTEELRQEIIKKYTASDT